MTSSVRREIRAALPGTLDALEPFIGEFRHWCRRLPAADDRFAAELLLREALNNAVVHGCGGDASRQVRCAVRWRAGRLSITVADDGEGFDWRRARNHQAPAVSSTGRGMEIFRVYATRVRFNRKGNVTTLIRRLQGQERTS
ncbi:Anti-sigma-factor antagonist (fragment) [Candidatus Sulfopaludibacter sp. SbA4]